MKKVSRLLPAALLLLAPITLLNCPASSPSRNPIDQGPGGGGGDGTNRPTFRVVASRADVNANGQEQVLVTGTAFQPNGSAFPGQRILWEVSGRNFAGAVGTLSILTSTTNSAGQGTTVYRSPDLDFVPVGAFVIVTGTLVVPNNPQGSPKASASIVLRPEGVPPAGSGGTGTGTAFLAPIISVVAPAQIRVDTPITVLVTGSNFADGSRVLIVSADGITDVAATVLSATQLRFTSPTGLTAGPATLFVTGPGNTLSQGFAVTLVTSGGGTGDEVPSISAILPNAGPVNTNIEAVLLGSAFNCAGAVVVFVGSNLSPSIREITPSTCTATSIRVNVPVASSTGSGPVSVFVRGQDGKVTNTVTFTYTSTTANLPRIDALAPNRGATTGLTRVTVSGQNFSSNDTIVIAGPNVESPEGEDLCFSSNDCTGAGTPVCSNNRCELKGSTTSCRISGSCVDPFDFVGSGLIEIVMPNVGTNAAGPADVFIQTNSGLTSNIVAFNYESPINLRPPVISFVDPTGYFGAGCCPQGDDYLIVGQNFRKCSSVIIVNQTGIRELLPTPDVSDCGIRRSSQTQSPRERLEQVLFPDGMSIKCGQRNDLVPLRPTGTDGQGRKIYLHDLICDGDTGASSTFADELTATMIPSLTDVNDITSGGAFTWVSESEIRLNFSTSDVPPCESSDTGTIYVSNDPGRGLSGDVISNGVQVTYENTQLCPKDPTITSISPQLGSCQGGTGFRINGSGMAAPASVQFDPNNKFMTDSSPSPYDLSVSSSAILGDIPPTRNPDSGLDVCAGRWVQGASPGPPFFCEVDVFVSVSGVSSVSSVFKFTYRSTDPGGATCQ